MNPSLARDIEIFRAGPDEYLARNPAGGSSFQLDSVTHFLMRSLDGTKNLDEIRAAYRLRFHNDVSRKTLDEFLSQLERYGMLEGQRPRHAAARSTAEESVGTLPDSSTPLLNALLDVLVAVLGWLYNPVVKTALVGLGLFAVTGVAKNWDRFVLTFNNYWASPPVLPLALLPYLLGWLLVFTIGAFATACVCRRYHGRVTRIGLRFHRGLIPVVYCDIGDSFIRLNDDGKWAILTVRMWAYLGTGSIAALVWNAVPLSSSLAAYSGIVAIVSTVSLLTSIIVFLPRDGSLILAYLYKDPHFRKRALAETGAWLGMYPSEEPLSHAERWRLRWFGLGIVLVNALILILAVAFVGGWLTREHGAQGGLLVIAILVWALYDPVRKMVKGMIGMETRARQRGGVLVRWLVRLVAIAGLALVALLPYDYEVSGQARLIPAEEFGARAQVSGQLVRVFGREGDRVEAGALLARLDNPVIESNPQITAAQLERVRAELDLVEAGSRAEQLAIARSELDRARSEFKLAELELDRATTVVGQKAAAEALLDRETYRADTARHSVNVASERLALAVAGNRPEEVARARAHVQELEASLRQAEQLAAFLEIRSPISGFVVTPYLAAQEGQYLEPGDLILTVKNDDKLAVEVAAEEPAGGLLKPGDPVNVRLTALDGRLLHGTVRSVSRVADTWEPTDAVRTDQEQFLEDRLSGNNDEQHFRVLVDLEQTDEPLRAGMLGFARMFVREEMLWESVIRPVVRFFRTDVWSWIP